MGRGSVLVIQIAPAASAPMVSLCEAQAVSGRGLVGDRYFKRVGTFSGQAGGARDLTLIESETIEALEVDYKVGLRYGDLRRNLVTLGVRLPDLVEQEFSVGEVIVRGTALCEPCAHIIKARRPEMLRAMTHKSGLRARILTDGMIRVGDIIQGLRR